LTGGEVVGVDGSVLGDGVEARPLAGVDLEPDEDEDDGVGGGGGGDLPVSARNTPAASHPSTVATARVTMCCRVASRVPGANSATATSERLLSSSDVASVPVTPPSHHRGVPAARPAGTAMSPRTPV